MWEYYLIELTSYLSAELAIQMTAIYLGKGRMWSSVLPY